MKNNANDKHKDGAEDQRESGNPRYGIGQCDGQQVVDNGDVQKSVLVSTGTGHTENIFEFLEWARRHLCLLIITRKKFNLHHIKERRHAVVPFVNDRETFVTIFGEVVERVQNIGVIIYKLSE